ncbi:cerebellar degeneration-related protein 2-like [Salarias fasciatus]|uniref:Cerebellar degeneration-related protein 2-like n=1 Tax=Salarias fasciatus TaxID=181472 RepID=A0A672FUI2_SALFA|nr:cerebellar degeneration-related protein 2-like [Salarias fasciatus]
MLADMILEEEFEKNGEPWYDPQELQHDLHLAAELGKTLLSRNHDLEQALQQMYSTNQEQLQEIEYLTKQVDLLRQMNDQHAKVYEQLDVAARDLEQGNQRLVQDNRVAQQKIHSLTEIIEGLQTYMDDLQTQVDDLKTAQAERNKRELAERRSLGAQSVSCLKELYDLHQSRYPAHDSHLVDGLWLPQDSLCDRNGHQDPEEENESLQRSIQTLQSQISTERSRREAAEREIELTLSENRSLEQRLALLTGCRARQTELEAEVEQLQVLWRADCAKGFRRPEQLLLPDTVFFGSEEQPGSEQADTEEEVETNVEQKAHGRQRCNSDSVVRATNSDEIRRRHEQLCIRRAEAVKQRGISLLNEVDAQYSALQVKYDELLQRCQQASDGLSHKAVQTSSATSAGTKTRRGRSSLASLSDPATLPEDGQQPEYKALFREIFTCIQKTKEDISESRRPDAAGGSQGSAE